MTGNTAVLKRADPWRWMILFSRFLVTFLLVGNFKSMGVFLPHIEEGFATDTAVAGFVIGSSLGFGFVCIGPFLGILKLVWSPRRITIVGGCIAAMGILTAACSSTIVQFATSILISSIGGGIIDIAVIQPLIDYFPEDFAMANGLSLAGGPLGMMVLPPTMEYLLSIYGWRRALGLMASLSANFLVCGAVLRPCQNMGRIYRPLDHQSDIENETSTERHSENCLKTLENGKGSALQLLRKFFDAELLTQPIFISYQVLSLFVGLIYSMWHLFLIPLGVQLGHGETLAAFLGTFAGVGTLTGRLGQGYPIDRKLIKTSSVFLGALLVFAASSLLNPLVKSSYVGLATLATISGISIGVILPLVYVLMVEVCPGRSETAFGWLFCSLGTGILFGGFSAGWIHDFSDDYNVVFVAMGALSGVMAIILSLTICFLEPKVKG